MRNGYPIAFALFAALSFARAADNALTSEEAAAGYDLLFDGSAIAGWHAYYKKDFPQNTWSVKDDAPLGPRIENYVGSGFSLVTDKPYRNLDLKVEVQTPANGESGVFIRNEEMSSFLMDHVSGPEFQVCGPNNGSCSSLFSFGSCYDMFAPIESLRGTWYNPPGTWNRIRIIAFDSNVVHYGNGKKLLEYKIGTPEFMSAYSQSRFITDGNNGRYYDIHPGGIVLQHHGETGIAYRNLKAKELAVHPFLQEFKATGKWPDTLSQDFVFGSGTTGLSPRVSPPHPEISPARSGSGVLRVRVSGAHSRFEAWGIDGRPWPVRSVSEGVYELERAPGRAAGLIVARAWAEGRSFSRTFYLP